MFGCFGSWVSRLPATLALAFFAVPAQPQEFDSNAVHWAYASFFGTGWYRIGDFSDAFVIRATQRWELVEPSFEEGLRKVGIEFRLPVTVGLDNFIFDDPSGSIDPSNLATLSVNPGVDVTVPVNSHWSLRPFASIGWGTVLSESESAWSYWAGVKSHYHFGSGPTQWALLNSIGYVGYTPSEGRPEDFWPFMIGLELDHEFAQVTVNGEQAMLTWHGMYTTFENDLDAVLSNGVAAPITDQWEFGLALRKKESRIKIWFMKFDRLGLAYRFSSNGQFQGIALIYRSAFDR